MDYPLVNIDNVDSTRDRILLTAVRMFSERGYADVSIRDIAERVEIKPSSFYNHFSSKDELFDTIIDTISKVYLDFYNRTDEKIAKATCFAQVLDCLFSELFEVYHMFIYYGVNLLITEQSRNETARDAFNNVYMKVGIDYSTNAFTMCIEKGWVKPFDARGMSTLFMNSVFVGSIARAQEDLGYGAMYNTNEMFKSLYSFLLNAVEVIA
ncbi:TetR/AcrR family transcriptional regulator [Eubacteriales bacterium OttesenSCG-928-N13]|nr:TetR/AcrR family transcriptional regulator [Eubacteriales bacterium OttesenSCG-928-N13]